MNLQATDRVRAVLASRWTFLWQGWGQRHAILDLCLAAENAAKEEATIRESLKDMRRELDASKDLYQANLAAVSQELVRMKRGNDKLLKFIHETRRLDEPFDPNSIRGILQAETNKRLKPKK